jgi:hypothetical protein
MSISKIANHIQPTGNSFPPVHKWNPDLCKGQEFFIDREGEWFYNNSPIKNYRLTKLFSTVLRKDDDSYYLVTPHEKVSLKTAIAPYVITDFNFNNESLELITNFEYSFVVNEINTIKLINFEDTLIPIVHVRDNIEGFFNRSTYYNLINFALENNNIIDDTLYISSGNKNYPVGKIA